MRVVSSCGIALLAASCASALAPQPTPQQTRRALLQGLVVVAAPPAYAAADAEELREKLKSARSKPPIKNREMVPDRPPVAQAPTPTTAASQPKKKALTKEEAVKERLNAAKAEAKSLSTKAGKLPKGKEKDKAMRDAKSASKRADSLAGELKKVQEEAAKAKKAAEAKAKEAKKKAAEKAKEAEKKAKEAAKKKEEKMKKEAKAAKEKAKKEKEVADKKAKVAKEKERKEIEKAKKIREQRQKELQKK